MEVSKDYIARLEIKLATMSDEELHLISIFLKNELQRRSLRNQAIEDRKWNRIS